MMGAALLLVAMSPASAQEPGSARFEIGAQAAAAQQNVPQPVKEAEAALEEAAERFGLGVFAGVGLDPELIMFGGHARFGPIFTPNLQFRPGIEFGVGEVTTLFGVHFDFLYTLPGATRTTRWTPYVGAGPNLGVSHMGFEADDEEVEERNRFDFSDTDFDGGLNVLVGVRNREGVFLELKATAYGVSNVKLLAGFNF
jgi:hypothetical protein